MAIRGRNAPGRPRWVRSGTLLRARSS